MVICTVNTTSTMYQMIGTYLRKTVNQSIKLTKRDLDTCSYYIGSRK